MPFILTWIQPRAAGRLRRDTRGQDLIEYAMLAAFVAVAAGAFLPPVGDYVHMAIDKCLEIVRTHIL